MFTGLGKRDIMHVEETESIIHVNRLVRDYLFSYDRTDSFFSHEPFAFSSWQKREDWLSHQSINHRLQLTEGLNQYNLRIGNHPNALQNIEKLGSSETRVVIGGQQAGLLTGPIYVIHKAITILKLAETMQQELGRPIVPVFWIASEDHDFAEVNHTYVRSGKDAVPIHLPWEPKKRASIGQLDIPPAAFTSSVEAMFAALADSPFQAELRTKLAAFSNSSQNLSELFAKLMAWLFGDKGLVLVDSADQFIRELEKPIFRQFLTQDFNQELNNTNDQLQQHGYDLQVVLAKNSTQLFLLDDGERQLLLRDGDRYYLKQTGKNFSQSELLDYLEREPTRFSANVVSRPIMQEHLFPVLAFVGGYGEVAYWAQLKWLFSQFSMQMPIVYPRMTFTIIDRNHAKLMEKFKLSYEDLCLHWQARKEEWLCEASKLDLEGHFARFATKLSSEYAHFSEELIRMEPGVTNLAGANLQRIMKHVEFLQQQTARARKVRYQAGLEQWDQLRGALYPLDKPQERVYNIFGYLNQYGMDFLDEIFKQPLKLNAAHKLVYI
jgi:bacillithiol biosynthesis cysteine-adding enzyme BshC